jgi:hypothetical protein
MRHSPPAITSFQVLEAGRQPPQNNREDAGKGVIPNARNEIHRLYHIWGTGIGNGAARSRQVDVGHGVENGETKGEGRQKVFFATDILRTSCDNGLKGYLNKNNPPNFSDGLLKNKALLFLVSSTSVIFTFDVT